MENDTPATRPPSIECDAVSNFSLSESVGLGSETRHSEPKHLSLDYSRNKSTNSGSNTFGLT